MSLQVYIDGGFCDQEKATISVWDHGFLYGDGVFEGIRVYNGRVFQLDEHLRRLSDSAKAVALTIPLAHNELKAAILETCRRNELLDGYIRVVVSRGKGDLGLDPRKCVKPTLIVIADKIKLYPEELYRSGLRITIASTRKTHPEALNGNIKSLNYLNNILAKIEATRAGADEAVLLSSQGFVTECTSENIFVVKGGVLHTPPPALGILVGVTRNVVIRLAKADGILVQESLLTTHDLYVADEIFLTGTGAELIGVVDVDGRAVGEGVPGPMTQRLLHSFRDLTKKEGVPVYPGTAQSSPAKAKSLA